MALATYSQYQFVTYGGLVGGPRVVLRRASVILGVGYTGGFFLQLFDYNGDSVIANGARPRSETFLENKGDGKEFDFRDTHPCAPRNDGLLFEEGVYVYASTTPHVLTRLASGDVTIGVLLETRAAGE